MPDEQRLKPSMQRAARPLNDRKFKICRDPSMVLIWRIVTHSFVSIEWFVVSALPESDDYIPSREELYTSLNYVSEMDYIFNPSFIMDL